MAAVRGHSESDDEVKEIAEILDMSNSEYSMLLSEDPLEVARRLRALKENPCPTPSLQ